MLVRKLISISLLSALLLGALPYHQAAAQSPQVQAARETVEKNTQKITESKKTAGPIDTEQTEVKQATLESILKLTNAELNDTLSAKKLGAVVTHDDVGLVKVGKELSELLVMYRAYTELVAKQVARDSMTAEQLKLIAAALKEWREKVYDPAMRQAFDALLVTQGGDVLAITQQRLDRVNADVKKVQTTLGSQADALVEALEGARKNVAAATSYYSQARELLTANQESFSVMTNPMIAGAPQRAVLRRGAAGDFACAGVQLGGSDCQLIYRLHNGARYELRTAAGEPIQMTPSDISSLEGSLIILAPLLADAESVGIFFVRIINPAISFDQNTEAMRRQMQASILEAIDGTTEKDAALVTVQSLIKKEIEEIGQAYQAFFSMSKMAKKLLAR